MALNYVTVTLDLYDGSGNPVTAGRAQFTPNQAVQAGADHQLVVARVDVPVTGPVTVPLLATDNAGVTPAGWAWTMTWADPGGASAASLPAWSFTLPYSAGAAQRLSAVLPAGAPPALGALPLAGGSMTGPIAMGGAKITGLAAGTASTDAATVAQTGLFKVGAYTASAITAQLTAAAAAGGGTVYCPAGTYTGVTASLTLGTNVVLAGDGPATVITAAAGLSGPVVKLAATSIRKAGVRDLTIECGGIAGVTGISLDNTGLSGATPGAHRLWNVTVNNAGQDGFYYGNGVLETFTGFCFAFNPGRTGFFSDSGCTDSRWVACTAGQAGSNGFVIAASSNHLFTGCKAYYAGAAFTAGSGNGWYITASKSCTWAACEAQDCCDNGWKFDTSGGACATMAMHGCVIDACNAGASAPASALAAGISTNTLTNSVIAGNAIFNRAGGAGTMSAAIAVAGTQTGLMLSGNATLLGLNYLSGGGYYMAEPAYAWDLTGMGTTAKFAALDVTALLVVEGSNRKQGTATLNGTTAVVVPNTAVTATSRIFLTTQLGAGTVGAPYVSARTAGTSFSIKSTVAGDTSTVAYLITEPG